MKESTDVRQTFKKCMTCSRTYCHLINDFFEQSEDNIEKACDPLAGGLMNQGKECGMLWGSTLALGIKAAEMGRSRDESITRAMHLARRVYESFESTAGSSQCKDIIDVDLTKVSGMLKFIIRTSIQGSERNPCYQLAEDWYPEAIETITITLEDDVPIIFDAETCTSRLMYMMGGSIDDEIMVAGWGGGIGMSGQSCGALAAAIWKVTKDWCDGHPGKNPPYFTNRAAKRMLKSFSKLTGGTIKCSDICGRKFNSLEEHNAFVKQGGCEAILDLLAEIGNKEIRILKRAS